MGRQRITKQEVRDFWEENPLSSAGIPFEPGTPEFFAEHTRLRELETTQETKLWAYNLEEEEGKQVLDVGCGNGYVTCQFAEAGANVVAIDLTERAVELTQVRLAQLGLTAEVIRADAEALPFGDETFDTVVSFGVIHHTPDTEKAVKELHRVLKPDGRLRLMLYHRNSFAYRALFPAKRLLQRGSRGQTASDQVNAVDGPTNPLGKVYSKSEVRALLHLFTNIEFRPEEMFFNRARHIPTPLRNFIARRWGWHLYIRARKSTQD
jgi:ubiquinone/menaquinone biosynthesis C-methylase UbiE